MKSCCITTVRRAWGKLTKRLDNLSDDDVAKESRECPRCGNILTLTIDEEII